MKEQNLERRVKTRQRNKDGAECEGQTKCGTQECGSGRAGRGTRLGQGRQRNPGELRAAAPRHSERTPHHRPHRPSTGPGPGSDREQPGEGRERTRGDKQGTTRRRRPLPAGPVGKRDGGRGRGCREPGETKTVRGLPLARFGLLHRLGRRSSLSYWKKTALPGSAPSRLGPPHIAIAATATTAAEKPDRHRRSATSPVRPASMRTLPSPEGAGTSRRYLRSTGPEPRGPAPGLSSPPPPAYSLPSLRLGPAPSNPCATPLLLSPNPSAVALAPAPTEISRDLSALCGSRSQVPARMGGLRQ